MFRSIWRILPVCVVCWLSRRYCSVLNVGGSYWHQPWTDVLILSAEDAAEARALREASRRRDEICLLQEQLLRLRE